ASERALATSDRRMPDYRRAQLQVTTARRRFVTLTEPRASEPAAEAGAAVVEFVLVSLVAVVLAMSVAQLGLFLWERNALMGSLSEGARVAAAEGRTGAGRGGGGRGGRAGGRGRPPVVRSRRARPAGPDDRSDARGGGPVTHAAGHAREPEWPGVPGPGGPEAGGRGGAGGGPLGVFLTLLVPLR